jgi:hypothetical protein
MRHGDLHGRNLISNPRQVIIHPARASPVEAAWKITSATVAAPYPGFSEI